MWARTRQIRQKNQKSSVASLKLGTFGGIRPHEAPIFRPKISSKIIAFGQHLMVHLQLKSASYVARSGINQFL